ncbi:hypothetical protein P8452_01419 [Trifolium repens]|nr:hypothetical protein P8452_01419 [Trifolium repens]
MGPEAFMLLCHKLRGTGYVKDTIRSTVEEQVAKFLHIIGHNVINPTVSFFFHRSGETVSRHFHNVLRAIISLEDEFPVQPSGRDVALQILNNSRFYPFFKDCIGAIDGTHIRVKVPRAEAPRFRGRKDYPTQNVLAACNFDMKFTYVLPGWEGTASDSRILKDALSREDSLKIPEGKYYLGDAGFMLKCGVLTPYRDIVLACCILHNFLMGVDVDEALIAEVDPTTMPKGKTTKSDSNHPGRDILQWNDEMDQMLLNALAEEANKGNRHDGAWTTEAYNNMVKDLRSTIGPNITKNHIKNRMKTLKNHFAEAYDLFHSLSGFSWNPITRKFDAEDDVWEELIKGKPHAARWRKMQIKHYDILTELFATDRARGNDAKTAKERMKQWEKENIDLNNYFEDTDVYMPNVGIHDENQFSPPNFEDASPQNGQINHGGSNTSRGTKRKRNVVELAEDQYERMNESIMTIAEALKEGNSISKELHQVAERQYIVAERQVAVIEKQVEIAEKQLTIMQQTRPRHYSESDVWDLLEELRVTDPFRMQVYDHLCDNEHKKRKLFGVPPHMRGEALLRMMTDAGSFTSSAIQVEATINWSNSAKWAYYCVISLSFYV